MMKFTMSSLTLTGGQDHGHPERPGHRDQQLVSGLRRRRRSLRDQAVRQSARHPDHAYPGNVVTVLLKLLNSLTPLVPVTMTNVTTDDFLVASDSLQANDLTITSG